MARLSSYVEQLQKQGYSIQVIRSHLARSGYSAEQISAAFSHSDSLSHHLTKNVLFGILASTIILSFVIYFIVFYSALEVFLEIKQPSSSSVAPGETLIFEKVISASEKKAAVNVFYEAVSSSGEVLVKKTEKLLISDVSKSQSRINIPATAVPGTYTLKVTITFGSKSQTKSFLFTIAAPEKTAVIEKTVESSEQQSTQVSCPSDCNSPDTCVTGKCVNGACVFEQKIPCCGNGKCESSEEPSNCATDCAVQRQPREGVIASAESIVQNDASQALLLCNSLIEDSPVDECISSISQKADNSVLCSSMRSVDRKDACFMSFALGGDFSVCDKIADRYMSNSCNYLESAKSVQQQK